MRKLERRARLCMLCTLVLVIGLGIFIFRFVTQGDTWATYPANQHIYTDGNLTKGVIYDRDGDLLARNTSEGIKYNDDEGVRRATVHVVGDKNRSISNSAETTYQDLLTGYNLITGVYSHGEVELTLTIDSDICKVANNALNGRKGTVGVYNYETGEIVCLVSSPNFDPLNPPQLSDDDTSGTYINRFTSSAIVPGSIFKLLTTAAVIENVGGMDDWTYTCEGVKYYGNDKITCPHAHGTVNFEGALANSCNCAFAELSEKVGSNILEEYVEAYGLTKRLNLNGIKTAAGSFSFPGDINANLAWAGIGQYEDLINPCSFLRFVGAIAGGGSAAEPRLLSSVNAPLGIKGGSYITKSTGEIIESSTADKLKEMMKINVEEVYGESSFPGLDIYAKSGTAELGGGKTPNSWFTGFITDKPYAFIVLVENGGSGTSVAGGVANTVLQELVD